MEDGQLKIYYKIKCGISDCFDQDIIKTIEGLGYGYKFYARGMNFQTGIRDIAFNTKK